MGWVIEHRRETTDENYGINDPAAPNDAETASQIAKMYTLYCILYAIGNILYQI